MLNSIWTLVSSLFLSIWQIITSVLIFASDSLLWLHIEAPRLEGLLVGILLAWFLMRRDSHPILKLLSAPLKLVLDILDLSWDHSVEFISDAWDTGKGWVEKSWDWCKCKLSQGYNSLMSRLGKAKKDLE